MIKKGFKNYISCISLFFVAAFCLPAMINAAEINVSNGESLADKIATANAGDVLILESGTYTGNFTIDKALTIKGADQENTIINGNVTVSADATIQNIKINAATGSAITVTGAFNLETNNATFLAPSDTGIWLTTNADNAKLTADNVTIDAKYGVWVRGANQTVYISNSNIKGYAALDISGGKDPIKENNNITVTNSILTGVNNYQTIVNSNEYGTIVIGNQKDANLIISNSTITNEVASESNKGNEETLLLVNSGSYAANQNCTVSINDSELINTDTIHGSAIYNFGNIAENGFSFNANNVTVTSANDIIFAKDNSQDIAYVTFIIDDTMTIKSTTVGSTIEQINGDIKEGFTFLGWYTNDNEKFDFNNLIETDMTLTAKYEAIENEQETPIINEDIENPNTSDNILLYIILGLTTAGGTFVSYRKLRHN